MNRYHMGFAPCSWSPKLNPKLVRLLSVGHSLLQRREASLHTVELHGEHHRTPLLAERRGVQLTPNHSSHADPFAIYHAADRLRTPFYIWLPGMCLRSDLAYAPGVAMARCT